MASCGMPEWADLHIARAPRPLPAGQPYMPPFEAVARQALCLAFPESLLEAEQREKLHNCVAALLD